MGEESLHRREMEKKLWELDERRTVLTEENQKVEIDLMRGLIDKLQ